VKKLKASVVATVGSQKAPGPSKSLVKGRPKKSMLKNLLRGKYKVNYNHHHLQDTLLEFKNDTMSERAASKGFGVSCWCPLLYSDRQNRREDDPGSGRPPSSPHDDEEKLIKERLLM
jgi:hypothetical protein